MEGLDDKSQASPLSTPKSFIKRFNLREVQVAFGNLKRNISLRNTGRTSALPAESSEAETDAPVPPYKELYLQQQTAETVLNELDDGYFQHSFDPIEFELQKVGDNFGQEEVDAKVDQMTAALEVTLFSALRHFRLDVM